MTDIILKELEQSDGKDVFDMIQEIGPGQNGFINDAYNLPYRKFSQYKEWKINESNGIGLGPDCVPQTIFVLYAEGYPVGYSKLRHCLTYSLRQQGGHISYCIRPTERQKGYGTILLRETLKKAKNIGLSSVLLTCTEHNTGSRKVMENNGAKLEKRENGLCYYWIYL